MNNWDIKISEVGSPKVTGFNISIENNGEVIAAPKNLYKSFDKAVNDAQKIIRSRISFYQERNKKALSLNQKFIKTYINSGLYNGVYNSLVKVDKNNNPYLEVAMNTSNKNLDKLIPNVITDPSTKIDYKVVKVNATDNSTLV